MSGFADLGSYVGRKTGSMVSSAVSSTPKPYAPGTGFANIAGGLGSILGAGGLGGLLDEVGDLWSISKGNQADRDFNDFPAIDERPYPGNNGRGNTDNTLLYLGIGAVAIIGILYFLNKN